MWAAETHHMRIDIAKRQPTLLPFFKRLRHYVHNTENKRGNKRTDIHIRGDDMMLWRVIKNEDDIFCTCPQTHTFGSRFSALQRHTPREMKKEHNSAAVFLARRLAYSPGKQTECATKPQHRQAPRS